MIEKSIERPLLIGNFTNGGGEMAWAWWMRHHSKLAIVGSAELSPRKKFVKKLQIVSIVEIKMQFTGSQLIKKNLVF